MVNRSIIIVKFTTTRRQEKGGTPSVSKPATPSRRKRFCRPHNHAMILCHLSQCKVGKSLLFRWAENLCMHSKPLTIRPTPLLHVKREADGLLITHHGRIICPNEILKLPITGHQWLKSAIWSISP